jgi:hypothetical protein
MSNFARRDTIRSLEGTELARILADFPSVSIEDSVISETCTVI